MSFRHNLKMDLCETNSLLTENISDFASVINLVPSARRRILPIRATVVCKIERGVENLNSRKLERKFSFSSLYSRLDGWGLD